MAKEAKKQEKLALAAARQAHKEAKEEAARRAQQEEDELVEGLDELEMVLMRQQLRAKVRGGARAVGGVGCLSRSMFGSSFHPASRTLARFPTLF